jgi:UDP-N-acetylmuramate dehydrogenase
MIEHLIREHEPLSRHTSWRIGGTARYYSEVETADELRAALRWARQRELPVLILGGGTNLLVREQGFAGLALRSIAREWHVDAQEEGDSGRLFVQAGAPMAGTVRRVSAQGWGGLEWAEGLPGTIGGAVFGNAGCYGGDIAGVLEQAWVLIDDEVQVWPVEQMGYGYRTSHFKREQRQSAPVGAPVVAAQVPPIIVAAAFHVVRADASALAETMAHIASMRKSKTPWGSSCGSVFKNPPAPEGGAALSAGQLIDQAGLKGRRIGKAEISHKHANYIVNLGGASSDDVLRLIELAHDTVLRQTGIDMQLEVQMV